MGKVIDSNYVKKHIITECAQITLLDGVCTNVQANDRLFSGHNFWIYL